MKHVLLDQQLIVAQRHLSQMQCSILECKIYMVNFYTGDPGAPTSWPVAAFYTSNKHQVANCYKNSPGCHYLQIVNSYKPRTIIVKVKVDNETLYSDN